MESVISNEVFLKYLSIILLLVISGSTLACSCAQLSGRDVMESSYGENVFIAFVTEAKTESSNEKYVTVVAKFEVEKVFKTSDFIPTEVETYLDSAACGFPIEVGSRYIFVAANDGEVNYCTSRLIPEYEHDVEIDRYLKDLEANMKQFEITKD
jgi:hypothetical protein